MKISGFKEKESIKLLPNFTLSPKRVILVVILIGLLIRMLVIPFSMHVDPQFTGDIAAIPEAVNAWNSSGNEVRSWFIYPPLAYYTFSVYLMDLAKSFTPDLLEKQIFGLEARYNWLASFEVFRDIFVLKIWYLFFDLGIMILLWAIFRDEPNKVRSALIFWAINPVVIYSAYIHGQYDLIPLFFVVLSLLFFKKGQAGLAALSMGIGICYKNFPLPFLVLLVLMMGKNWPERIKLILIGTIPYILLYIPVRANYQSLGPSLSGRFFVGGYELGNGAQIYFFFVLYAALIWYIYKTKSYTFPDFWKACMIVLLIYYQFSYFDPHYWIWIIPFATIFWVEQRSEAKPFFLVIGLCLLALLAPIPVARFLAPISPRFFLGIPSLMEALNPYLPMLFITNVVRSFLAGTCFYLAWRLVRGIPAAHLEIAPITPDPDIST